MKCLKCGTENDANATVCSGCFSQLEQTNNTSVTNETVTPNVVENNGMVNQQPQPTTVNLTSLNNMGTVPQSNNVSNVPPNNSSGNKGMIFIIVMVLILIGIGIGIAIFINNNNKGSSGAGNSGNSSNSGKGPSSNSYIRYYKDVDFFDNIEAKSIADKMNYYIDEPERETRIAKDVTYKTVTYKAGNNLEVYFIIYNNSDEGYDIHGWAKGYKDGEPTNQVKQGSDAEILPHSAGCLMFLLLNADDFKEEFWLDHELKDPIPNDAYTYDSYELSSTKSSLSIYFTYNSEGENFTKFEWLAIKDGKVIDSGNEYIDALDSYDSPQAKGEKGEVSIMRFDGDLSQADYYIYFYGGEYD